MRDDWVYDTLGLLVVIALAVYLSRDPDGILRAARWVLAAAGG
jgi:hypothetical protein